MASQRRNDIDARANKLLNDLKIHVVPVPVERIARLLGAQLRISPLDDELSGLIFVKQGVPIIGVNALHHPHRQRFTIAHEIAHLHLHRDRLGEAVHIDKRFAEPGLRRDSASATGTERVEIEANQFAAALLMPHHHLQEFLAASPIEIDDDAPLDRLAKKFNVSKATLQYRIKNLVRR